MTGGWSARLRRPGRVSAVRETSEKELRGGFTLVEVVMALLVLEIAVVAALGTVVLAAETLRRAETLERAAGGMEAVLDSLRRGAGPAMSEAELEDVRVRWSVDSLGKVEMRADHLDGASILRVHSAVPLRDRAPWSLLAPSP